MPESTLSIDLNELEANIGFELGYGRGTNYSEPAWDTRKQHAITDCRRSGSRMFYYPAPLPGDKESYSWTFMSPIGKVTLLEGQKIVALPDDFAGFEGPIQIHETSQANSTVPITNPSLVEREYSRMPERTGYPVMACSLPKTGVSQTAGQRFDLYVFPIADQDYELRFPYYFQPDSLTVQFPYAHGGSVHSETIKAACLAAAELYQDNDRGKHYANFVERMRASVSLDRKHRSQQLGVGYDPSFNEYLSGNGDRHMLGNSRVTYSGVDPDDY